MTKGEKKSKGYHVLFIQGPHCPLRQVSRGLQDHPSCGFLETVSGPGSIAKWAGTPLDAVLLDLDFGGPHLRDETIHEARARGLCLLGLSRKDDRMSVLAAIGRGINGYLLKDGVDCDEIIIAIREMKGGGTPISARAARHLCRFVRQNYEHQQAYRYGYMTGFAENARLRELSSREREVLGEILSGKSNKAIAAQLRISPYTVAEHVKSIFRKLNVHSRTEAIRVAYMASEQ